MPSWNRIHLLDKILANWVAQTARTSGDAYVRDNRLGVVITASKLNPNEVALAKSLAKGFYRNFPQSGLNSFDVRLTKAQF